MSGTETVSDWIAAFRRAESPDEMVCWLAADFPGPLPGGKGVVLSEIETVGWARTDEPAGWRMIVNITGTGLDKLPGLMEQLGIGYFLIGSYHDGLQGHAARLILTDELWPVMAVMRYLRQEAEKIRDDWRGYVKGNVRWVHKHVNIMKNRYTDSYFINLCRSVAEHQDAKRPNQGGGAAATGACPIR